MKKDKKKAALLIAIAIVIIAEAVSIVGMVTGGKRTPDTADKVSTMAGYVPRYHPAHKSSGEAWALAVADGEAVILDIRSEESYNDRHVSGAVNVLPEAVTDYAASNLHNPDVLILCYCFCGDSGGAAYIAYTQLTELGYTRVFYMDPENEWSYEGTSAEKPDNSPIISGDEAKRLYNSDSSAILLDVRNQSEYDEKHIDGSLLIPVAELDSRLSELPDKNTVIIVYCKTGIRSQTAFEILSAAGYINVYNMQSFENWTEPPIVG